MSTPDPDSQRLEMLDRWERAAVGWRKRADEVRDNGMPVSIRMIEHLGLQPGLRVLELAAGPGDTGFLASELIAPGGTLISSDGTAAMLDIARDRAGQLGVRNVEFRQLNLEWIDLETASVDAVLCRWGFMLILDPSAAARETRRVLRPGGRLAIAVWDEAARNPWATIPGRALIARGLAQPPDSERAGHVHTRGRRRRPRSCSRTPVSSTSPSRPSRSNGPIRASTRTCTRRATCR